MATEKIYEFVAYYFVSRDPAVKMNELRFVPFEPSKFGKDPDINVEIKIKKHPRDNPTIFRFSGRLSELMKTSHGTGSERSLIIDVSKFVDDSNNGDIWMTITDLDTGASRVYQLLLIPFNNTGGSQISDYYFRKRSNHAGKNDEYMGLRGDQGDELVKFQLGQGDFHMKNRLPVPNNTYMDSFVNSLQSKLIELEILWDRSQGYIIFRDPRVLSADEWNVQKERYINISIQYTGYKGAGATPSKNKGVSNGSFSYYGKLKDISERKDRLEFFLNMRDCLDDLHEGRALLTFNYPMGDRRLILNLVEDARGTYPTFLNQSWADGERIKNGSVGAMIPFYDVGMAGSLMFGGVPRKPDKLPHPTGSWAELNLTFPGLNALLRNYRWEELIDSLGEQHNPLTMTIIRQDGTSSVYNTTGYLYGNARSRGGMPAIIDRNESELESHRDNIETLGTPRFPGSGHDINYKGVGTPSASLKLLVSLPELFTSDFSRGRVDVNPEWAAFDNIKQIKSISFTFVLREKSGNDRKRFSVTMYPQLHLDVWSRHSGNSIPLLEKNNKINCDVIFSSYQIPSLGIIEDGDNIVVDGLNHWSADTPLFIRAHDLTDTESTCPVTFYKPIENNRASDGSYHVPISLFSREQNNAYSNRVNLNERSRFRYYDVALLDGTVVGVSGADIRLPSLPDPLKPIQMHINKYQDNRRDRIRLAILTRESVIPYAIVLPEDFPAVFEETNNHKLEPRADDSYIGLYYEVAELKMKPGKTLEDFYAKKYDISLRVKRAGTNGQAEVRRDYTTSLLPKDQGAFTQGERSTMFFDIGHVPELAEINSAKMEYGVWKGRFSHNGIDITANIGSVGAVFLDKENLTRMIPVPDNWLLPAKENAGTLVSIVYADVMKDPSQPPFAQISNSVNSRRDIYQIDYLVNATRGLRGSIPTPQGSLFDEVNQIYFMGPFTGNPMIVVNCNDGIVVDRVEIVEWENSASGSFTITGNPVKNTNLKGYTQSLALGEHRQIEDICFNKCKIRITVSKSGRNESKEFQLVEGARGRFAGQVMFFSFFNHGIIPSKITYGDFQHEHPYGRTPILFKAYENNGTTPLPDTAAVAFYSYNGRPNVFYPIRKPQGQDYWGMPTRPTVDGSSSKIPNIAVIDTNGVIRKLSDYSERVPRFVMNRTTFLIFDKKQNRFEFKLHQHEKTIAKDIQYLIAMNHTRGNLAQPATRLTNMTVFFIDDETGIPSTIASFTEESRESSFIRDRAESSSFTDELIESRRFVTDENHGIIYANTFGMNVPTNKIAEKFDKLISAGRQGKVVIAFHEDDTVRNPSIHNYKYAYWCRLRDDIVQHNSNSRFLIFTGVDDIYTVPKMVDFQISQDQSRKGWIKFNNRSTTSGYIYDADKKPYAYAIGHPRYEFLDTSTNEIGRDAYHYTLHRNDDIQVNTSSKPLYTHMIPYNDRFSYDNRTELLVVGINGLGEWEHSIESIGVIAPNTLPAPQPEIATDDVERVIWRAATGNIGAFSQTMVQVKFKASIPAERRNGNTVYFRILDSKGNRIGQSSITVGQYQQFNASLGVLNDIASPYLTIESYTDAGYTRKVSETRIPNALFGRQQTVASINNGQPFTAAQSNNLYMQYYLYPESLKITNVNPTITINDTSVINSKYVVVVDQNIPPQRDAYFFGHGSWRMTSQMSGDKLYMSAPINDTFPAGTKQDYFLEWQEGGELKGISGVHDLPTNIKSVGDNVNIPNGFLVLDNQARGQLTLTADSNFITNTTYKVESVEGNARTTIADKGYTGFRQNPQATFNVNFPGKTPDTLAISQTKINVEMTVDNNLVTSKSLGFANNQLSSTAYGAILPLSNTGSTIPKYNASVVKSQDDPVVTFNLNSQNRNNTIGKIAVLRPGNNGLSRVEINHDGSANGIRVRFDYFTKAGSNNNYEALFLLYGKGADANKVIGHAVISLPRNQLKEDSPDYDFGLGQITMILNKSGNGAVIKAMVPHGLLTRAEEFVLLTERKPNSTYNVTLETGTLYDIVSIDGVLKNTPQPGSAILQFGIRKSNELKRGKRITLVQTNPSVVSETQDSANGRVYAYDYASVNTANRIDMKLVKKDNHIHAIFTDSTGKNVTPEVNAFTIVHNSIPSDSSWLGTFSLHVSAQQLTGKFESLTGSYKLSVNDHPQLLKVVNITGSNDKRYGVVLVHRSVNDALTAIYHNTGFINTSSEIPATSDKTIDLRYVKINSDEAHTIEIGLGKDWYDRPGRESGLQLRQLTYVNKNGSTSTSAGQYESLNHGKMLSSLTAGAGILPKDIIEGNDKYAEFTYVNNVTGETSKAKLYKDPYIPNLYTKKFTPRVSNVKHIAYHGAVDNQHILPLAGIAKRSDKIGFDVDYALRRNALVRDIDISDAPEIMEAYNSYRIVTVTGEHGDFSRLDDRSRGVLVKQELLKRSPSETQISVSPNYSAMLPDINQNFTENCGEANKTRELSEWRAEATVFDPTAHLDMSDYPIMEITGAGMRPTSTDILRIRGPQNGTPVILNQEYNQILSSVPRIIVIEGDICFDAAEGTNLKGISLIETAPALRPLIIFRGRLIMRYRNPNDVRYIGLGNRFIAINETHWGFDQLLVNVQLPERQVVDTNNITHFQITKPTGETNRITLQMEIPDKVEKPKPQEQFYFATEDTFLRRESTFQVETSDQSDNPRSTRLSGNIDIVNRSDEDIVKSKFVTIGHNEDDRKLMLLHAANKTTMNYKYDKMENNRYMIDNQFKVIRDSDNRVMQVRAEDALYIQYSNNGTEVTCGLFFKSVFRMNPDVAFEFDITTNGTGKLRHRFAKDFQREGYWYTFYKSDKIYHKHSLDLGGSFDMIIHQGNRNRNDTVVHTDDTSDINRAKHGYGLSTVSLDEFKEISDIFEGPGYSVDASNGVQWVHMTDVNVTAYTSKNITGNVEGGSNPLDTNNVSVIDNIERVTAQVLKANGSVFFVAIVNIPDDGDLPETVNLEFQATSAVRSDGGAKAVAEVLLTRNDSGNHNSRATYTGSISVYGGVYFGRSATLEVTDLSNQETLVLYRDTNADRHNGPLQRSLRGSYIRDT